MRLSMEIITIRILGPIKFASNSWPFFINSRLFVAEDVNRRNANENSENRDGNDSIGERT